MRALLSASPPSRSPCPPPRHTRRAAQTVERLYVMDCGHNAATDQARWSPGVNVGKPIELSDTCYLIKHGGAVAALGHRLSRCARRQAGHQPRSARRRAPRSSPPSSPRSTSSRTTSPWSPSRTPIGDHVGNVDMFPTSTLLIQKAEVDWAFADGKQAPFKKDRPMKQLTATTTCSATAAPSSCRRPGHTPGHQSLLVHLPQDRLCRADRRPRALQGQLGQRPRAVDEHQRRPDPCFACQGRRRCWPTRRRSSGSTMISRRSTG